MGRLDRDVIHFLRFQLFLRVIAFLLILDVSKEIRETSLTSE